MRVAVFARTKRVLKCVDHVRKNGHEIVFIATDEPAAGYEIGVEEYKAYANSIGAEFLSTNSLRSEEVFELIRKQNADIAISGNWLTLVPKRIIELFQHGVLNAHAGDLPRYRGNAASNWAIINGEKEVVLTIHKMSPELDAGDILVQRKFLLKENTYIAEVRDFIVSNMPQMFLDAVNGLENGSLSPTPQDSDPKNALRVYARSPIDGKINWNLSAEQISRIIRASGRPFNGSYTFLGTEKITIWKARPHYPEFGFSGSPGQISYRDLGNKEVWVICGDGMIVLEEIEHENEGVVVPTEFINTIRIRLGMDLEGEIANITKRLKKLENILNQ